MSSDLPQAVPVSEPVVMQSSDISEQNASQQVSPNKESLSGTVSDVEGALPNMANTATDESADESMEEQEQDDATDAEVALPVEEDSSVEQAKEVPDEKEKPEENKEPEMPEQVEEPEETMEVSQPTEVEKEEAKEDASPSDDVMEIPESENEEKKEDEEREEEAAKEEEDEKEVVPSTPAKRGGRGRPKKNAAPPPAKETPKATPSGRGRKRRGDDAPTPAPNPKSTVKRGKTAKLTLSVGDFLLSGPGGRVLSCGEGEQLGHPGRTTTKKPRKVDLVEEEEMVVVQVVAGGVHSLFLTEDGNVYSCGINEKGTVPAEGVEKEGSTDEFSQIIFSDSIESEGKIVMLAAGASFAAALTDKGSVIAWGNLRDAGGKIDVHDQLTAMQESPIVVIHHKKDLVVVKIVAGENHLVMLTEDGRVFTFGDCSMGQLGRSSRVERIRSQYMAADSSASLLVHLSERRGNKRIFIKNIFAGGYWTAMQSEDNRVFVCGLNNFGQLGIAIEEEEKKEEGEGKQEEEGDQDADSRELRIPLPKESPVFSGTVWKQMEGVQHIVALAENGDVMAVGKNTDNALGLGTWTGNDDQVHWRYDQLEKVNVEDVVGVTAQLASSVAWTQDGSAHAWGFDTSGQLGLGLKDDDDKMVPVPQKLESAHLVGYQIIQASIADMHCLFLAKKEE